MTRKEAILLSAYTGFLLAPDFSEVHKFCEDTLGRPIWTHEFADSCVQKEIQEKLRPQIMELVQNISALRPVSRERVEKVWRGCEWCNGEHSNNGEISAYAEVECDGCDAGDDCPNSHSSEDPCYGLVDRALPVNFCPVCGKPKTDEAVDMVMERLEDLHEEN